ncbi:MAG: hypothetical protein C0467_07255 [Planctomycetaceae bacterium]|nr:hypothetical protein [Planctomycetaceae bacterium]
MNSRPLSLALLVAALGLAGAGCRHFGPGSIVADRLPYNEAIARSWKEQALLNIVKMRYVDAPFFVDVPQITSGYTVQGTATANAGIFPPVSPLAVFSQQLAAGLNLQGGYQDRPTISYTPQTGAQFIRNLTNPINPGSVLFLIQSGYPADVVFDLMVDSINGVRNRSVSGGQLRAADPEFIQITRSIRKAQLAGHVGIRVQTDKDKRDAVAFFFHDKDADPELARELAEVRKILKVDPKQSDFRVTFGATASSTQEIAILSRSVLRVLQELSTGVDVPAEHLARGIAPPLDEVGGGPPLFRVCSGPKRPCDPFVAVCYEGRWFWVEKDDLVTKRTLGTMLILLALADSGAKEALPVITIQAN